MSMKTIAGLLALSIGVAGCGAAKATPAGTATATASAARSFAALKVTSPSDESSTRRASVTIRGHVDRGSRVTVRGRRVKVSGESFHARVALAPGANRIRIVARADERASTAVTLTVRRKPRAVVTPTPTPTPSPTPKPTATASKCDPNYTGACLDPNSADYDCKGGSGDGPDYTGPVRVVGDDHFGLDRDGDGYACEG
jgi:hypothetical protein